MRHQLKLLLGLPLLLLCSAVSTSLTAQDTAATADRGHDYSKPLLESAAQFPLPDGGGSMRQIHVHAADPASTKKPGLYFQRPLFAFIGAPVQKEGFPEIVHGVDFETAPAGMVALTFQVKLSTPALRAACRDLVIKQDIDTVVRSGGLETDVEVMRWPIRHCIIECRIKGQNQVLATAETGDLSGVTDDLEFTLNFDQGILPNFKRLVEQDKLEFIFRYTYSGRVTYSGSVQVRGLKNVWIAAKKHLSSAQADGTAPIFHADRDKIEREIRASVLTVTRVEHPDLYPLIDRTADEFMARMFDPGEALSLEDLQNSYPEIEAQLATYLRALVATSRESQDTVNTTTDTHEERESQTSHVGGSAGVNVGVFSVGAEGGTEWTSEEIDRLSKQSGVKFAYDQTKQAYVPHSITIYKMRDGWDTVSFEEEAVAFLSVGPQQNYRPETPVRPSFRAEMIEPFLHGLIQMQYMLPNNAPVGSMMAFAGDAFGLSYAGTNAPTFAANDEYLRELGWMLCDGRALSKERYGQLFQIIGISWGNGTIGTGGTRGDFNIPDMRGMFPRGVDHGTKQDPDAEKRTHPTTDQFTSAKVGTSQEDELGKHAHKATVNEQPHSHGYNRKEQGGPNTFDSGSGRGVEGSSHPNTDGAKTNLTVTIGSSGGEETRPKNRAVNWIIRVK